MAGADVCSCYILAILWRVLQGMISRQERNADQIEEVARLCAGDPARPLVAAEVKEETISAALGAVRGRSAVSGRARGLDGSSPEVAISRYQLGKKLRHFQKLLAVLPSDLIANASSVIVTTSNTPRLRLGKSLIEKPCEGISFGPSFRNLLGLVERCATSEKRLRRLRTCPKGLDVTVEIPRDLSDNRILAGSAS